MENPLLLRSENGSDNCVIDGENISRGFVIDSSEDKDTVVQGFTVRNGYCIDDGGGMLIEGTSPLIKECVFENCTGRWGGGFYCDEGSPEIVDSIFVSNTSSSMGGSICFKYESNGIVTGCMFQSNESFHGAGLYTNESDIQVSLCTYTGNIAEYGGGICLELEISDIVTVNNCIIENGEANADGGGIYVKNSRPSSLISNCIMQNNTAYRGGRNIF